MSDGQEEEPASRASEPGERVVVRRVARSVWRRSWRLLEGGQLGLSESLARYEHGVKYLKFCYRQLERAERKIELLVRRGCGGPRADASRLPSRTCRWRRSRRPAADAARGPTRPATPDAEMDDGQSLF